MAGERSSDIYRALADKAPKGSLLQMAYSALAGWWLGHNGEQTIGRTGEVIPMADVLAEITSKLASGELVELPKKPEEG